MAVSEKRHFANIGVGNEKISNRSLKLKFGLWAGRSLPGSVAEGKVTGIPVRYAAGWIPVAPVRQAVHGNVALVGDAAGHTHPITGAGISSAVLCGEMAGTWAARAVEEGDVSVLKHYDHQWQDLFKSTLDRAHKRRQTMESDWRDFSRTVKLVLDWVSRILCIASQRLPIDCKQPENFPGGTSVKPLFFICRA